MQVLPLKDWAYQFETFRCTRSLKGVKPIHIAVAEDNPADVAMLRKVLDQVGLDYALTVAVDGAEARDFILKRGRYHNFPPADLIFLDMNMPKLTGLEVLREVPDSAELPICILSSSERERRSIEQHFAPKKICYIVKPLGVEHLLACFLSHRNLQPIAEGFAKRQSVFWRRSSDRSVPP
jgi:CheY-like chemotaxis protein